jgi:hypothetical protein
MIARRRVRSSARRTRPAAPPLSLPLPRARRVPFEENVTGAGTFFRLRVTDERGAETAVALAG